MEVQGSIYPLDLAALESLAEYLKVTKTKYEGKSRLWKKCNFVEEKIAENESVEKNATFLLDVKSIILGKKSPHWKAIGRKQLN